MLAQPSVDKWTDPKAVSILTHASIVAPPFIIPDSSKQLSVRLASP